ncbi:AAA family ATPase [Rhodoferax sp.]|uniref:AAA family ATPase n=1 Tax=Rhodoferax sp. TaxID=50421 RepID=UPI0027725387|nr:ATP-binding protein [Rhodoferax sp.]
MKIAIVGAESTGKTRLALELTTHFQANGQNTQMIEEFLREWCEREQRTPQACEQRLIAQEQARRINACANAPGTYTVADTTPLMIAVYSDLLFGDLSLYAFALQHQRDYDLTLLTGLDLPWVADGLQRDGPHVRPGVDRLVRRALNQAGIAYHVVHGQGGERLARALSVIEHAGLQHSPRRSAPGEWTWTCAHCDSALCELRMFTELVRTDSARR